MKARSINGFTLIEMIVTLVIASLLLVIAAPNLRVFLQKNHMAAQVNLLLADLHRARSEAVKRRTQVTICRLGGSSTLPTCASGDGKGWEVGWFMYTDNNKNGVLDTAEGDILLSVQQLEAKDLTIRGSSGINDRVRFSALGLGMVRDYGSIVFCDDRIKRIPEHMKEARVIILDSMRIRVVSGNQRASVTCPL